MKKSLLTSSAIVGAALMAVPAASPTALAGTPAVGDNFTVTIAGGYRFSVLLFDQDVSTGRGRGYQFRSDEAEIKFSADGVADNGLEYGFNIELQAQTNDTSNSDETWGYVAGDAWGRVEIGDQDDAADRIAIGGEDSMVGRGGYDGAVGDVFNFGANSGTFFTGPGATSFGDASKITYFTPRLFGFQAGASWTPDAAHNGGATIADNDDTATSISIENGYSLGINFAEDFNGVGVIVAGTYIGGQAELRPTPGSALQGAADVGDFEQYQIGAQITYEGFSIGAAYGARDDAAFVPPSFPSATGGFEEVDAGYWWDVGASYSAGPWAIGVGAFFSEAENGSPTAVAAALNTGDTEVEIYSITGSYDVAPGLGLRSDLNFVEAENIDRGTVAGGTDNDGVVFVFSTVFSF